MKKIISLILLLVTLTGCSSDYKLTLEPSSIKEEINFSINNNETDKAIFINELFRVTNIDYEDETSMGEYIIDRLRNDNLEVGYNIDDFYTKQINKDKINLTYTYKLDTYENSNVFNSCFGETFFDETEDYYVINGYEQFRCMIKDKVKVEIETDYRVIDSNADKIKGNKYIWYFTKSNNLDHEIYIQVSKKYKQKSKSYLSLVIVALIIIILFIYKLVIKNKKIFLNSNNDI